MDGEAGAD